MIHQIGRWAGPLVAERARKDTFRSHWIALPVKLHLRDRTPETRNGEVQTRIGSAADPDLTLTGALQLIVGVLM